MSSGLAAAAASKSCQSCPDSVRPHRCQPTRLPSLGFSRQEHWSGLPFPSPMHESDKRKWSCSVVSDSSMDWSLPGSSIHGIFQARVLEWAAIAFSKWALGSIIMNKASGGDEFQLSYSKSWKMMLWKCCTQYASKFEKLSSGHRTGKGQFSFQSQWKAIPKNVQTTAQLHSSHMLVK